MTDLIDAVGAFPSPLALVSPEVGLTVVPQTASGRRFADELGSLNQRLAALCDRVVLVVAGQPLTVKEPAARSPTGDGLRIDHRARSPKSPPRPAPGRTG